MVLAITPKPLGHDPWACPLPSPLALEVLGAACVDMHVPGPPYCACGARVPVPTSTSCLPHVPEAQGSSPREAATARAPYACQPRACGTMPLTIPRNTPCYYSRRRWVAHLRREFLHVRVCRVRRGSPHQLCADRRGDGAAMLTMAVLTMAVLTMAILIMIDEETAQHTP